jgi:magnesium-transporting ATPase (P-type)
LPVETPLSGRTNSLFMGTHVISGSATAAVVFTGKDAEFDKISERLKLRPQETEFERGVARFGYFLMEVTLVLVSWEKDGEICCFTLIKMEGLTDRVKDMLGPVMKEMM